VPMNNESKLVKMYSIDGRFAGCNGDKPSLLPIGRQARERTSKSERAIERASAKKERLN